MGRLKLEVILGAIVLIQTLGSGFCEEGVPCQPSFHSEVFVFSVHRPSLHRGARIGEVRFDACGGSHKVFAEKTENSRIRVDSEGRVHVQRPIHLHSGEKNFTISILGSKSKRKSAIITLVQATKHGHSDHHGLHHQQHPHQHHHHHHQEQSEHSDVDEKPLPVLVFPHSSKGLKRRKRDWVIPPISFPENARGPFPKPIVQIRSNRDKEVKLEYSITGPGADEAPVGIFSIDKASGWLSVTQPLDRENIDKYILMAHALSEGENNQKSEDPMEINIKVNDQNDNQPKFTQDPFLGSVAESSPKGFEFMMVTATDADEPETDNSDIRYKIMTQDPESPHANMFFINPKTGGIQLHSDGLDRELFSKYTLVIQAADRIGNGLSNNCTAIVSVTDSNDNAPQFVQTSYEVSVPENEVGALVVKMPVTDKDEPHTPAWSTKYNIIEGNNGGFFNVSTGTNKLEGIITTAKGLDFEKNAKYTLLVTVENEAPFATRLPTSTATVIVNVLDENEAPVFNPVEKVIVKPENLDVGTELILYTATDPDTARNQKVWYKSGYDPAGWLNVNKETGLISVRSPMDRESPFVKGGRYRALILGIDNDDIPATGTGTLLIELEDVNDNAPIIEEREITVCNQESKPVTLSVSDKDGPGFAAPFRAELQGKSANNWTIRMIGTRTGIELALKTDLEQNDYNVIIRVYDNLGLFQDNTVHARVCACKGDDFSCTEKAAAGAGLPGILGILGAILL